MKACSQTIYLLTVDKTNYMTWQWFWIFPPLKINNSKWSRISHGHNGYYKASRWWTSKLSGYWWWSYNRSSQGCFQDHQWGQEGTILVNDATLLFGKDDQELQKTFFFIWLSFSLRPFYPVLVEVRRSWNKWKINCPKEFLTIHQTSFTLEPEKYITIRLYRACYWDSTVFFSSEINFDHFVL